MAKKRRDIMLSVGVIQLLDTLKKQTGHSKSQLIEDAIYETYQDPIKTLTEKKRKLVLKVNDLSKKIKDIEEIRKDKKFKPVEII